jgi:predicted transcriptional regulator
MNEYKSMRKELGVSVRTLAELIKCNICSIYNFEKGLSKPRYPIIVKRIEALVKLFNMLRDNPNYLIELFKME